MDEEARRCTMQMRSNREQNKANFRLLILRLAKDGQIDTDRVFDIASGRETEEIRQQQLRGEVSFDRVFESALLMAGAEQCLDILNEIVIEHLESKSNG